MGGNFTDVPMIRLSYNDVHNSIQKAALKIKEEFEPTLFIAIGGGGFIPARILRTFLKTSADGGKKKNIPIQAVGLTLYEDMGGIEEVVGKEVIRTQWLDFSTLGKTYEHGGLLGRRVLIVDEVDDTRTTLMYLVSELRKDIDEQLALIEDEEKREQLRRDTQLGIFVVHNKLKPKAGELPADVKYYAAQETPDVWLAYPWECETSIEEHDADRVKNFVLEA